MEKFYTWFTNNRKTIGMTVGVLNILVGLTNFFISGLLTAVLQLTAGAIITFDAWRMKDKNEEH